MRAMVRREFIGNYVCESNRRKNVMLTIRRDLLSIARENRINLSKLLENTLIDVIQPQNTPIFFSEGSFGKESSWCGHRDLNPGRQRGRLMS